MPNTLRTKCVIVGDSTVGKTAIVQTFVSTNGHTLPKSYQMTCGVDLHTKVVRIPDSDDKVEMILYDSSGKNLYVDVLPQYWNQPNLYVAVYDVTSESSLKSTESWVELAKNSNAELPLIGVLFANKTDLKERRVVSPKSGKEMATSMGIQYFEGSAANYEGIDDPFFYLANEWHKNFTEKTGAFGILS